MKKLISLGAALALVFSLGACSRFQDLELPPLPTVTPEPTIAPTAEPTPEPTQEPETGEAGNITVTVTETLLQAYDPQNGTELILSFSYDSPKVYIEGGDEAMAQINEHLALQDEIFYSGNDYGQGYSYGSYNDMLTAAEDNYRLIHDMQLESGSYEYSAARTALVRRIDDQAISILYRDYYYTGGAHGSQVETGLSFDAQTGQVLTLEDLSGDYEALSAYLLGQMLSQVEADPSLQEKFDFQLQPEGASYESLLAGLIREGNWYLGSQGLVFFSDQYELGSYAVGTLEITIGYDALQGHIDDKWIPEAVTGQGSVELISAQDMAQGSTQIVDKLVIDQEGQEFYLVGRGTVRDLHIEQGHLVEDFYPTANYWTARDLNDKALQLQCSVSEGMPQIRISFRDEDGSHELYLSQGEDGGAVLIAADQVQAVG